MAEDLRDATTGRVTKWKGEGMGAPSVARFGGGGGLAAAARKAAAARLKPEVVSPRKVGR